METGRRRARNWTRFVPAIIPVIPARCWRESLPPLPPPYKGGGKMDPRLQHAWMTIEFVFSFPRRWYAQPLCQDGRQKIQIISISCDYFPMEGCGQNYPLQGGIYQVDRVARIGHSCMNFATAVAGFKKNPFYFNAIGHRPFGIVLA